MAPKTISLNFIGYWREKAISGISNESGIYVVYECFYDPQTVKVNLKKIIYIGEGEEVQNRIAKHEKWPEWRNSCGINNELCFSYAPVINPDRERGEAALIYKHKPPVNEEHKYNFSYDETTMSLSGEAGLLTTYFTVLRND